MNMNEKLPQRHRSEPILPQHPGIPDEPLWRDKRRPFFGKALSFTTYTLYSDRLLIDSGIISLQQEEIRLYRIIDITLRQTLFQRLFRLGTLRINTVDSSSPRHFIRDIRFSADVMKLLSDTANEERKHYGFCMMEHMSQTW